MVREGILGTPFADGPIQLLATCGDVFAALRGYDSWSVDPNNLNSRFSSTLIYVSDVVNRLLGRHQTS